MDILNLSDWDIIERTEGHDQYTFRVRYTKEPAICPQCGKVLPRLQRFGKKIQPFRDLPIHGKKVLLLVIRARFRCLECHQTFYEHLDDLDDSRRSTRRFVAYVEKNAAKRTFTDLADELGVNEKTIRNIFTDYLKTMDQQLAFVTPRWLGIDEINLLGKARCVLANVEERTIYDILSDRKRDTVVKRLSRIKDRDKIELVTMDMWEPYRAAAAKVLPEAQIVVDKYHVVRMANQALDRVRKTIREGLTDRQRRTLMHDRFILLHRKKDLPPEKLLILEVWLDSFPLLKTAYELKEDFYKIWGTAKNSADARKQYDEWVARIPDELAETFSELATAIRNWNKEVFAYFDHPITNAFTEALNGLTKLANRMGRGYSFKVIRAKMMYTKGVIKVKKAEKKARKQRIEEQSEYILFATQTLELGWNVVGADIEKLTLSIKSPNPELVERPSTESFSTQIDRGSRPKKDDKSIRSSE